MKIYVAAPWTRRTEAAAVAAQLEAAGHTITHDWWNHECGDEDHEQLQQHAQKDYDAVFEAKIFLLLNLEKSEGKAVETGLALAASEIYGSWIIAVGQKYTNIFQHLEPVIWKDTIGEAFELIDEIAGRSLV